MSATTIAARISSSCCSKRSVVSPQGRPVHGHGSNCPCCSGRRDSVRAEAAATFYAQVKSSCSCKKSAHGNACSCACPSCRRGCVRAQAAASFSADVESCSCKKSAAGTACNCACPSCRRGCVRTKAVAAPVAAKEIETKYLSQRMNDITSHFPAALALDDFLARVEVALGAHGFRGDNSIAVTNLCRDESTAFFKSEIDHVFGSSFNINGLGACITCGALGFKAGFSHAPTQDGRERYVFFSFPHVAVDSEGKLGAISRPGRSGASSACGALIAALGQFQNDPALMDAYAEGAHEVTDPEFSILKQRLAARIKQEGVDVSSMTLVDMTNLAQRTITSDLEGLIKQTVDPSVSDYAVITGVHIHNWGNEGTGAPSLEWIEPAAVYMVNDGRRTTINLDAVPALTPRQLAVLQQATNTPPALASAYTGTTTVVESEITDPAAGALKA